MKTNKIYLLTAAALTAVFSACSSDVQPEAATPVIDLGQEATFTITTEKFQSAPKATRSLWKVEPIKKIDLDNGLTAEVSVQEDEEEPESETRANLSEGHYTIYAIDDATGNRVTGPNSSLKGRIQGTTFVKDAGSNFQLPAGNYTFVCINDGVIDNGTSLSFTNGVKNPMLGKTQKTINVGDKKCHVAFQMKHLAARVRFNIVAYTESTNSVNMKLAMKTGQTMPIKTTYDLKGTVTTTDNGTMPDINYPLAATSTQYDKIYVLAHKFLTADYLYVQPGTNLLPFCELVFNNGEVYTGIKMENKAVDIYAPTLTRNKSYTYKIKVNPKHLYFFNDGSNGVLSEKGSRTPIGLVLSEKTNTNEGIAVSLKSSMADPTVLAQGGQKWEDLVAAGVTDGPRNQTTSDKWLIPGPGGSGIVGGTCMEGNGYDLTRTGVGTTDGKIRMNETIQYPAFHWAGNYNPGAGQWYVPAFGEIMVGYNGVRFLGLYGRLGYSHASSQDWGKTLSYPLAADAYFGTGSYPYTDLSSTTQMFAAFNDAGGELPENVYLWTSSTSNNSTDGKNMPIAVCFSKTEFPDQPNTGYTAKAKAIPKNTSGVYVLPFAHF